MEIPAEFVLANPTLCGEAIVEAWKAEQLAKQQEYEDWRAWIEKTDDGVGSFPMTKCLDFWAGKILTRLRELGYRRYHIGVDFAAEGTESKSAPPQMAPDAKCMNCGEEFRFVPRQGCSCDFNEHCSCPGCGVCNNDKAKARFRAAHPPAEPANPPKNSDSSPAPDEADALAMKLKERFALAASTNDGWRYVAAAVLRRERAARYGELQRAMAHVPMNNEQAEWFVSRINKLKGGE